MKRGRKAKDRRNKKKRAHSDDYLRSIFQNVLEKCDTNSKKACRLLCKTIALLIGNMDLLEVKPPIWKCIPSEISHLFRHFSTVSISSNLQLQGFTIPQATIVRNLKLQLFNLNKIDYIPNTIEKLAIVFVGANLDVKEIEITNASIRVDTLILDSELILKNKSGLVQFTFLQNIKVIKKRHITDYCKNLLESAQNAEIKGESVEICEIPLSCDRLMISNQEIPTPKDHFICKELVLDNVKFEGSFFDFMNNLNKCVSDCSVTVVFTFTVDEFRLFHDGLHFIDRNFNGLYPESRKWTNIKNFSLILKCKVFSFKYMNVVDEDRTFIVISRNSDKPFLACSQTKPSDWISITQLPDTTNQHIKEKTQLSKIVRGFSRPWNYWIKSIYDHCERID